MQLWEDYAGPFQPDFHLGRLSRAALARLGREYMMVGHVSDRVLMPIVGSRFGPETMTGKHWTRAEWVKHDACDVVRAGVWDMGGITPVMTRSGPNPGHARTAASAPDRPDCADCTEATQTSASDK